MFHKLNTATRKHCHACGFNPRDPEVWVWWKGLTHAQRCELLKMSDGKANMRTFTDAGVSDILEDNEAWEEDDSPLDHRRAVFDQD